MPSPPVRAPNSTTRLPGAVGLGQLDLVGAQHADAQRVDQRVAGSRTRRNDLAADVRQAQAVAVAADAGDHAGQHPGGVGGVEPAEAQRVHDRDRAGAHRQDVADDAADAGGRAFKLEMPHNRRVPTHEEDDACIQSQKRLRLAILSS